MPEAKKPPARAAARPTSLKLAWAGLNCVAIEQRRTLGRQTIGQGSGASGLELSLGAESVEAATLVVEVEEEEPPPPPVYNEESIAELNLENRAARTSGDVRFRRLVCCGADGRTQWSFVRGQPIRIAAEYEVLQDVSGLAMVLRLLAPNDTADLIVTDFIREITSAPVSKGMRGSATFVIDSSLFRSTTLSIYASLVDADNAVGFDVVDQNVSLPQITIRAEREGYLAGAVSIDCTFSATPPHVVPVVPGDASPASHA